MPLRPSARHRPGPLWTAKRAPSAPSTVLRWALPEHGKLGPSLVDAPAFHISSVEPRIAAGPMYAGDGVDVLEDWLGIDGDALADLVASGAIVL